MTRKVLIVLTDRANLGRLVPVMRAIHDDPRLDLQVVCAGTMPLARFGRAVDIVRADGFPVNAEVYAEVEGNLPGTMARSIGAHIPEFCAAFERLKPDVVVAIGDRYETLAAAIAAATMGLQLCHVQGGEVSSCLDERYRHMITKAATWHVPATERARQRLIQLGESPDTILTVGCPSSDLARTITPKPSGELLVIYHPNTTRYGQSAAEMREVLAAAERLTSHPAVRGVRLWWPNSDADSDGISKEIRRLGQPRWLITVKNMPPADYLQSLANAACAIGNSSSFCRDSSLFGTPVVLVGDRQDGRECGDNVQYNVNTERHEIIQVAKSQLSHGPYPPSTLYGDGHVSPRIVEALATLKPYCQKRFYDLPMETSLCAAAME